MIKKTDTQFSTAKLATALSTVLAATGWHNCQIALTRAADVPDGVDPFHHGTGDWLDRKTGKMILPESHFRYFDERLKGTYFEEVYHRIASSIPEKIARMRLMQLPSQACYSYHADDEYRYHIAINTNPTAFVIFEDLPPIHIPADGTLYGFEARKRHTAINCGGEPRVHLVVTTFT